MNVPVWLSPLPSLTVLDLVFLPEHLRGLDVGTRMMTEARRRAPGFYEKRGYREFGRIACDPPGTSRIFMVKDL